MASALIDVCVNITNGQFAQDRQIVLERARGAGIKGMLFTATNLATAAQCISLANGTRHLATAGVHPHDAKDVAPGWQDDLRNQAAHPNVRAIGECGLDFNRNFSPRDVQTEVFDAQIRIAIELGLPLFVHDRESDGTVLSRLKNHSALPATVIHCFTGTRSELHDYLANDYYIGITGWICDTRRGATLRNLVKDIPLDRLLLETDAPFLKPHNAPVDFQQTPKRRNEPALLWCVLETVAANRPESTHEIATATACNAERLFGFE